jgi:RNA polymerase sigma-70 factor (sigma-E family)
MEETEAILERARTSPTPPAVHDDRTDDAVLARLFTAEGPVLLRLARFFVADRAAAEDLVQEAFIRLSRQLHRIREPGSEPAYLRATVLNLCRDHNRRGLMSFRHRPAAEPEPEPVDEVVAGREQARSVVAALSALPTRQRDCVVLRYYLELPVAEIAATLGLSPNSVKTHLQRGLRALEGVLAPQSRDPYDGVAPGGRPR